MSDVEHLDRWLVYRNHGIESVKTFVLSSVMKVSVMEDETPHAELMRLLKAQLKARYNEIFGGLSHAEQAEYNRRAERIRELEECVYRSP